MPMRIIISFSAALEMLQSPSALPLQPTPLEDILEEDEEEEEIDREAVVQELKVRIATSTLNSRPITGTLIVT